MTNQIKSNQSVSFEVFILSLSSLNLLLRPNVLVLIVAADVALCGSSFMRWWRVRLREFIISRLSHLGKIKKIFLHNQQAVHRTKTGLWQALWKGRMSLLKLRNRLPWWTKDQSDAVFVPLLHQGQIDCDCSGSNRLLAASASNKKPKTCSVFSKLSDWVSHGFTSRPQSASLLRLWRSASTLHHQPSFLCCMNLLRDAFCCAALCLSAALSIKTLNLISM